MSDTNSISSQPAGKPEKPTPDYPLFAHATGRWAKKIKGKLVYFGPWADPDGAKERYHGFLAGTWRREKKPDDPSKPVRPDGDTTLFWHSTGRWAKKIKGKLVYFGRVTYQEAIDLYTQHTNALPAADPSKPQRPEGSPLFWHATGRWAKKIRGKMVYFGRGSHDDALAEYDSAKDDLHAGRLSRDDKEALTVYLLCAKFLITKSNMVKTGDLSPRSLEDYAATCKLIIKAFGKGRRVSDLTPDDFEKLRNRMARTWGPVRLGNEINRVRVVFSYAYKNSIIDRPMVFGEGFRRPTKKTLRKHRAEQGPKMFDAAEIQKMLANAEQPLRSMVLLGINCAFGNSDVGTLPISALDLGGGWITYHRPKTGIDRKIPLWAETVESLRQWLAIKPEPKDPAHAGLVFITKYGGDWGIEGRSLSNETRKLLDSLAVNGHRGFYCLRHTFQTIGDECGDFISVRKIMGHASTDISDVYRERVSDERLKKATEFVRTWLYNTKADGK